MHLHLQRISTSSESTLGVLSVDGVFECYTLEDTRRPDKVSGETRIPSGHYDIELRVEGGLTKKYQKKYPTFHKGMLWLKEVPHFEYVYLHIGNTRAHTAGCILVGDAINNNREKNGFLSSSAVAYERLYKRAIFNMAQSDAITLLVSDLL